MAKTLRFLVTIPASAAPFPASRDMALELAEYLGRRYDKMKVRPLTQKEIIVEPFPMVNLIPGITKVEAERDIAADYRSRIKAEHKKGAERDKARLVGKEGKA